MQSFGLDNVNIGTTGRLAMYETSCLDVGEGLIKTLFVKAARAAMRMGLDRFRSQGESSNWSLLVNLSKVYLFSLCTHLSYTKTCLILAGHTRRWACYTLVSSDKLSNN